MTVQVKFKFKLLVFTNYKLIILLKAFIEGVLLTGRVKSVTHYIIKARFTIKDNRSDILIDLNIF